jgi:amidase
MAIDDPSRRGFLGAAAGGLASLAVTPSPATAAAPFHDDFPFAEATIDALGRRMAAGETHATALARAYLERIEALDRSGPALRAIIETNPDALAIAEERDRERAAGRVRGPLHGVPLVVKDNIATADRMSTSAGSIAFDGVHAASDATLVRRLRDAGAVLLGKANLSEWANFRSSNSVSGWSSRGGQTRNPYGRARSPSGSSSGSAVAAAANLCAAAVGTETDGSITSPSACNNLAGLKPTVGLVSRAGIVPISHSQDTAGPMARTVRDCALLMNAMAGRDPRDAATRRKGIPGGIDFTQHLGRAGLQGVRLGVGRQYFGNFEKLDRLAEEALRALRDLGAVLVDVQIDALGKFEEAEVEVLMHEFKAGLDAFLANELPAAPVRSLAHLIDWNERHADRAMPHFGQDLLVKSRSKGPLTSPVYRQALARCRRVTRAQGIDAVLAKHRVDALVAPTSPLPWLVDPVNGDCYRGGCTSLAAVAGYPHLTVPAGFADGLPAGLSFFGAAFSDARLLGIGEAFERATSHRRAPTFLA